MRAVYRRRRDYLVTRLAPSGLLPVVPAGAFYALVDLSATGLSGMHLARTLLTEAKVATAPGSTFGPSCESSVRVSIAASDDDLSTGCDRLLEFWDQHSASGHPNRQRDHVGELR
jgi:aspartate aminotransferase